MVWSQVTELEFHANFVGGRLLGLCLNIGWVVDATRRASSGHSRPERALLWLAHRWATRRFDWLYRYDHNVAKAGFSELMSYQPKRLLLRRTWEPIAGRPHPVHKTRLVERAPPGPPESHLRPFAELPKEYGSRKRRIPSYMIS